MSKNDSSVVLEPAVVDDDTPEPLVYVPDSGDAGEGGKMKMIVQLVKKCLGVQDIASMILNLSKVCKPYNSILGKHFRAHREIPPLAYPDEPEQPSTPQSHIMPGGSAPPAETNLVSETASVRCEKNSKSNRSGVSFLSRNKSVSTTATSPHPSIHGNASAQMSKLSLDHGWNSNSSDSIDESARLRVVFVEQVSLHPPVSAYFASCPSRNVVSTGIDQISAKVSGTTIRVSPGQFNQRIFKFRIIIEYKKESWLGRAHLLVEGVVHTVHEGDMQHEEWTKVKHVPHSRIVAAFEVTTSYSSGRLGAKG
ncbi:hypothetical protein BDQ17DRAFT_1325969 [Cyathus striatus]|nr:hypothetical protein BDQ17DRAFT_1325969 [Cyathus striatus]